MAMIDTKIGIIVPTRNRPENIRNLLASIERSTIHPAICIIVDSSDFIYKIPSCSFPLLLESPSLRGQVKQRNYGINLLKEFGGVEYALLIDDDIVLKPDAILEAITGVRRHASSDPRFVGFALNVTNLRKSNHLFRRLLLHPKKPGAVTMSTFCSSLSNLDSDTECDWVLGGAAIWNLDFLIKNPNDYPLTGKAYGEDLYYCSKVRGHARFTALSKAKCMHVDHYEIRISDNICRSAYHEGINDTRTRIFIARSFCQYSVSMTATHILWAGFIGAIFGLTVFDRTAFMLGIGRIAGLMKPRSIERYPRTDNSSSAIVMPDKIDPADARGIESIAVVPPGSRVARGEQTPPPSLPHRDSGFDQ